MKLTITITAEEDSLYWDNAKVERIVSLSSSDLHTLKEAACGAMQNMRGLISDALLEKRDMIEKANAEKEAAEETT